ncbi:UPF0496 protein [Artemisia annua]|uniref:UPF0496 protein n=1 Tax=Artemisia annua TaxID=35608 RepID=A0A2U1KPX1_ARTAN|nr:UPF0496 protein [Artemisia annua]
MECLLVSKHRMWKRLITTIRSKKDKKQLRDCTRSINVNEEYQRALKSKSFAEFFSKARLVVQNPSLSVSQSFCHDIVLLEPDQETIAMVLESKTMSEYFNVKDLILDYFDISSEATNMCTKLLKSIAQIQSSYASTQRILDKFIAGITSSNLCDLITRKNPISNITKQDFEVICSKYSATLHKMKIERRKVAKKMKLISMVNKASGICVTAACGVVAVAAIALAAHTLTALVMGPAIFSFPLKKLKKKLGNLKFMKSKFLKRVGDQLDVAMKGTYILNRDFDTMIRLVSRLHDDIERNRRIIELCFERGRGEDKICLQVLRELEKSDVCYRQQVNEVEEHVYLCLLTINKARALVIKELSEVM